MTDIVMRLRVHAQTGDGWTRPDCAEAADEIERLRAEREHYGSTADARAVYIKMLERERDRLRDALLMWLDADDAGDGQECINAIAHARRIVGREAS